MDKTITRAISLKNIGVDELIANKLAAARHQDLADVDGIRAAKRAVTPKESNKA